MGRLTAAYDKVCVDLKECRAAMRLFPKDLWYMFTLKFLESYAYFSLSQVLVIYLHDEFGASDFEAGTAYGMFGAAITGWGLSLSWLNDNLGVKKSLLIGFSISTIASTIVACTTSKILLYITLFAFYPIGFAMVPIIRYFYSFLRVPRLIALLSVAGYSNAFGRHEAIHQQQEQG